MKTKNLIIFCIWTFILFACIAMLWVGERLSFIGYLLFFFVALMSTGFVAFFIPEN